MSAVSLCFDGVGHNYLCHLVRESVNHTPTSFPTYPHLQIPIDKNGTYTLYFSDINNKPVEHTGNRQFSVDDLQPGETAYLRFTARFDYENKKTIFNIHIQRVEAVER